MDTLQVVKTLQNVFGNQNNTKLVNLNGFTKFSVGFSGRTGHTFSILNKEIARKIPKNKIRYTNLIFMHFE